MYTTFVNDASSSHPSAPPRWQRILARVQVMLSLAAMASWPLGGSASEWMVSIYSSRRFPHDVDYARFAYPASPSTTGGISSPSPASRWASPFHIISSKRTHPFVTSGMALCLCNLLFTGSHST